MKLWRLYRSKHGPGLDGMGGLYAAGRWHDMGSRVVYFGASPAIVVLEKLAHIDPEFLPSDLLLARFEGNVSVETTDFDTKDLHAIELTRLHGENFLKHRNNCVLQVPSVLVPEDSNLLLNPQHPDALKIKQVFVRPFAFDNRLLTGIN